jgi:integrase
MKFTKTIIDKLQPGEKDLLYWDDGLRGFGLKVTPKGRKVFIVQKRFRGRPVRFTIGTFGQPWSLDMARAEALRLMQTVAVGDDPRSTDRMDNANLTVAQLSTRYWSNGISHKKPTTIANEKGLLDSHILPLLGRRLIHDLKKEDVQKFMSDVAAGRTRRSVQTKPRGRATVTGGLSSANRSLGLLSAMLSFAVQNQLVRENVAIGLKQYKLKRHSRFLSEDELRRIGEALRQLEIDGANMVALCAIKFLLLTGCRKNEALNMEWLWVNLQFGTVSLPDSKTGQKVLVIGVAAVDLLKELRARFPANAKYVFPGSGGTTPVSVAKVWSKTKIRAGIDQLRLHDLRHNFASAAVADGQSLYLVGKLLGHSQSSTTERYAHLSKNPVRAAADDISKHLAVALDGSPPLYAETNLSQVDSVDAPLKSVAE